MQIIQTQMRLRLISPLFVIPPCEMNAWKKIQLEQIWNKMFEILG